MFHEYVEALKLAVYVLIAVSYLTFDDSEKGQFAALRQVSLRVLIPAGILFFMMSLAIVGDGTPFLTVVPLIGLSWCLGIILAFRRVCDGE